MPNSTNDKADAKDKISSDDSFSVFKSPDKTSFWFDNDDIDVVTANDEASKSYVTATGQAITSWGSQTIDGTDLVMGGTHAAKIMGMPLNFSPLDDPAGDVFSETIEQDLPVVFFHPGKPKVNKRLFGKKEEGGLFDLGTVGNRILGLATDRPIFSMLGLTSYKDGRFISFKSDWSTYHQYVQTILQYIHASMGLPGLFTLSSLVKNPSIYGIPFYASKGTSISESSNNEYRQSEFAAEANSKAESIREKKVYASTGQSGIIAEIGDFLKETIRDLTQDIPVIGGLVGAFTENLDGSVLSYPDLWRNSTFDRSYSLEFRFYSPYGDPESIMKYVYTPFICLIAFGLPLQDSYYSYKQPFLVRLSSPGWFECDCGIIRSINIERGSEQTWTAENLPREIIVRLTVSDLYSSLMLSRTSEVLKYNTGLVSYIECMAGIRYDQLNLIKRVGIKLKVFGSSRLEDILTLKGLTPKLGDLSYNKKQEIIKVLR